MTHQLNTGAVRRMHLVVRRRARTFGREVGKAHQDAGWPGVAGQAAVLLAALAARPVRRWRERRLDHRLRLDTGPDVGPWEPGLASPTAGAYHDGVAYFPTPLYHFRTVLHRLPIDDPAQFAFVDLGCGKGRTLILAAEHGFRPVIGVELDLRLTGIARSNANTIAAAAAWPENPISVVNSDALAYPFPPLPTVVFLFNPFGAATLRAVLGNLERSLQSTPRRLLVGYVNPIHREVLDASAALRPAVSTRQWVIYDTLR